MFLKNKDWKDCPPAPSLRVPAPGSWRPLPALPRGPAHAAGARAPRSEGRGRSRATGRPCLSRLTRPTEAEGSHRATPARGGSQGGRGRTTAPQSTSSPAAAAQRTRIVRQGRAAPGPGPRPLGVRRQRDEEPGGPTAGGAQRRRGRRWQDTPCPEGTLPPRAGPPALGTRPTEPSLGRGRRTVLQTGGRRPPSAVHLLLRASAAADALATSGTRCPGVPGGGPSWTAAEVHPARSSQQPPGPLRRHVTPSKPAQGQLASRGATPPPWSRRGCPQRPVRGGAGGPVLCCPPLAVRGRRLLETSVRCLLSRARGL